MVSTILATSASLLTGALELLEVGTHTGIVGTGSGLVWHLYLFNFILSVWYLSIVISECKKDNKSKFVEWRKPQKQQPETTQLSLPRRRALLDSGLWPNYLHSAAANPSQPYRYSVALAVCVVFCPKSERSPDIVFNTFRDFSRRTTRRSRLLLGSPVVVCCFCCSVRIVS